MRRSIIHVLIVAFVLFTFHGTQCATACSLKECANHGSRPQPAEQSRSGCPHGTKPDQSPHQKQDGAPQCPQRQFMGESWLKSAEAVSLAAVDVGSIATASATIPVPAAALVPAAIEGHATKAPPLVVQPLQLRI